MSTRTDLLAKFKERLAQNRFLLHHCSMCSYPVNICIATTGEIIQDTGCFCVRYGPVLKVIGDG